MLSTTNRSPWQHRLWGLWVFRGDMHLIKNIWRAAKHSEESK